MTERWLARALVASAVLNVFLVGIGGTVFFLKAHGHSVAGAQRSPLRAAAISLSGVHRATFLELLRTEGKIVEADNRKAHRFREEAWASLSISNFDPATAEAELSLARALNMKTRGTVEAAVLQFAAELPRDERGAFGESMRRNILHQHIDSNMRPPATH